MAKFFGLTTTFTLTLPKASYSTKDQGVERRKRLKNFLFFYLLTCCFLLQQWVEFGRTATNKIQALLFS
jgi:hypothetical protein